MNTQTIERPTRVDTDDFAQSANQPPAVREPQEPARPRVELPITGFGKVIEGIAGVMAEIKPVEKLGFNKFHGYAHARIGDLNAELTPLMGKHGIVVFQNEVGRDMFDNNSVVAVRYEFIVAHKSGEIWPDRPIVTGVARCRTNKESFDDKTFNKCHTAARKYFLISLFQIPVDDAHDADDDNGTGAAGSPSRPTRRPPSPDGKATPSVIPIISGEPPQDWADRFVKAIADADIAGIDRWYQANIAIFEKLKKADPAVYNHLVDAIETREAVVNGVIQQKEEAPAPDPISSGPTDTHTSSGTQRAPRQRRAPAPPPAETVIPPEEKDPGSLFTAEETAWHESLENAYGACEDSITLAEKQVEYMIPMKGKVSEAAWREAGSISRSHLARVEKAAQE